MENAFVRSGSIQSVLSNALDGNGAWRYKDGPTMAIQVLAQVTTFEVRQAVGRATHAAGVINSVTVVDPGDGYTAAPTVAVTGTGTGADVTAAVSGGRVTGFTINNGGTGYADPLTVTIDPPYSTVGSTVTIQQSNDASGVAVTSATITVSGTTVASGGAVITGPWKYVRAVVSGTTGATATKTTVIGSI